MGHGLREQRLGSEAQLIQVLLATYIQDVPPLRLKSVWLSLVGGSTRLTLADEALADRHHGQYVVSWVNSFAFF